MLLKRRMINLKTVVGTELSCGRTVLQYCCLIAIWTAWKKFMKISHRKGSTRVKNNHNVMCLLLSRHVCNVMSWVKRSELSCGRTVLQYCCCLIAILTAWKKFMKISHRKGSTRVKNNRDVMCLLLSRHVCNVMS